ncbi:YndM family protein [Bacillus sp. T33-2]|uniref:YndM family protein n=1 Tax=Bacillus sp. T33-2 TaxID=2054168 RepID=UPI000C764F8D|nr:YndM family protein [Bacillus sp. T33-2]PLR89781.1 hypothetical protein CVD19_23550 [Bacillus sp. T33-2]
MRHVFAFAIKFMATLTILGIILGLFNNFAFTDVLILTVIITGLSYVIADLLVLRRTNNLTASLIDFTIVFFVVWILSDNLEHVVNLFTVSLVSAAGVTMFEYFYHRIVPNTAERTQADAGTRNQNIRDTLTEVAEELRPVRPDVRSPRVNENKQKKGKK